MSSKVTIVGNLGGDAELRYMPNGDPVTCFSICSNEYSRNGETQTWYNVNLFGNSEKIAEHLKKGTGLYIESGRLKVKPWEGRDGKTRVNLNVNTNRVEFTGGKRSATQTADPTHVAEAPADITDAPAPELSDDDIPF